MIFIGCSTDKDEGSDKDSSETKPVENEVIAEPSYNDTITFDGLEITFKNDYDFTTLDNEYSKLDGSDVIRIPVHVKNISDNVAGINMFYVTMYGSNGTKIEDLSFYFMDDNDMMNDAGTDSLRSGAEIDVICHILYDGDGDYYISFDNFSSEIEVKFPIKK